MKNLILTFLFCSTISLSCTSQNDIERRSNFPLIIKNETIKSCIKGKNLLFFSIADKWNLIIIENKDSYEELYLKNDSLINIRSVDKSNEILKLAFNKEIYHIGFIGPGSYPQEVKYATGNDTYFCFVSKDNKIYGETKATTIMIPSPINESVYNYLLMTVLNYITHDPDR